LVIAYRVDINGKRLGDEALFVPDGFLLTNLHLLPAEIAGKGRCIICYSAFLLSSFTHA
jgi:hypothetical protein